MRKEYSKKNIREEIVGTKIFCNEKEVPIIAFNNRSLWNIFQKEKEYILECLKISAGKLVYARS